MRTLNKAIKDIKYTAIVEGFPVDKINAFEKAMLSNTKPAESLNELLENIHFVEIIEHFLQEYGLPADTVTSKFRDQ
jgi:hypothetical protein